MNAATRRGFVIFAIIVVVTAVFCVYLPFFGLPRAGWGVGLPVISLPAEVLVPNGLYNFMRTDIFGFDITNTMTSLLIVDVLMILMGLVIWNATYSKKPEEFVPRGFTNFVDMIVEFWYNTARNVLGDFTKRVLPLALTVFFFLLFANWVTRIPIFETVGMVTCAEPGFAGYPLQDMNAPVKVLKVDSLVLGERGGTKATAADTHACEEAHPQFTPPIVEARHQREEWCKSGQLPADSAVCKQLLSAPAEEGHEGEGTTEDTHEAAPGGTAEPTEEHGALPGDGLARVWPVNDSTAEAEGAKTDLFAVIPFLRALATDINLPLALAIIVFLAVQIWGIAALGPSYFFKFINIPALGNLSKKPMGVMDFVVGLIEIISEFSRLISLPFRLLGNIFAGGILYAVMTFLVAGVLPVIFGGLEFFVGAIQAYVFAMLTIMYASQAVTAHHGDDHDEHGDHAEHTEHSEHAAAH